MRRNRRRDADGAGWSLVTLVVTLMACGAPSASPQPPATAAASSPLPATSAPASAPATSAPVASASAPAGAATLIAFVLVPTAGTGGAAEISGPDQIDRLVGGPPEAVESARAAVARHRGTGNRLFAFVLSGCRNTAATLAIRAGRITATLTGGEGTACFVEEWYLAVFAVPADLVPPGTRIG